jgi:DNA-binding CsgD family transcriptional regulator
VHQRDRRFTLAGGSYRLLSSGIAGGALAHNPTLLILVDRSSPELPAPGLLVERFGLTPREAEIGLLLAEGLSNQAIATRLGLSAHTVRHHVERLFDKLDVRSRKALALFFLRGAPAAWPVRNPGS